MGKYLNASRYEEKKSVSRLLPELAVFGNYSQSDDTILGDAADGYTVGARVKLNLFNGFSDFNHIREQRSRYRSLLNKVADKRLAIKVEVKDGYYSVLSAQKRLRAANKRVDAVREALAITERRFKAGLDKITDLLDREVDVKEAELGMYMSKYDLILSKAKLLFAAGILK
jgi:outer membrane protein TolC